MYRKKLALGKWLKFQMFLYERYFIYMRFPTISLIYPIFQSGKRLWLLVIGYWLLVIGEW